MQSRKRPTGMFGFTLVWAGQLVSVLSTNMTAFALTIWVFEETGSATALGLMQVFFITPFLLISPIAGVMVDRYNRKLMMVISDMVAGAATMSILVLQAMGMLQVWHAVRCQRSPGSGKCLSMAGLFRRHQPDGPQGAIRACQRHDVAGRIGSGCPGSPAGRGAAAAHWLDRDFIVGCSHLHSGGHAFCCSSSFPSRRTLSEGAAAQGNMLQGGHIRLQIYLRAPQPAGAAARLFLREFMHGDCLYCPGSHDSLANGQ